MHRSFNQGPWTEHLQVTDHTYSLATKYTTGFRTTRRTTEPIQSNLVGNSLKSMRISVAHSLRKLQTDYIDILYVHWWDFTTSVEEVMHGLNALVASGKVLYLAVSDTPAWIVVKANDYARANGLRPFSVYQGKWNAGVRDLEREVVPMCRDQGMGIAPWAPLGQGRFRAAGVRGGDGGGGSRNSNMSENDIKVSDVLEAIAKEKDTTLHAIVSQSISPYASGLTLTKPDTIGPRLRDAQNTLRLPHHRPAKRRTSKSQYRGPKRGPLR